MNTTERYSGRSSRFANTLWGHLYRTLYIHPTRFYGDLQHTGIVNWHARVQSFVDSFPRSALVVDIGAGARRIADWVLALDINHAPTLDIVGDGHHLPLRDASLDGVVVQMVLEHVAYPEQVLTEVHRVLKCGGRMYCEVPFLFPVHDRVDYRRWTAAGLARLCQEFDAVEIGVCMGPFSALSALIRHLFTVYAPSLYIEAAIDLLLGWLLWPLKYLDLWLPSARDANVVAGALYAIGTKDARNAGSY